MKTFIDYAENLRSACVKQSVIIRWLILLIIFLTVYLVYLSFYHAEFIIPYNLNKKTAIAIHEVTPVYLSYLALADASLYFDVDKQNIQSKSSLFLGRVYPSQSSQLQSKLALRVDHYKKHSISEVFYPGDYHVDIAKRKIKLTGLLQRWLAGKPVVSRMIVLTIQYVSVLGHLYIKEWHYESKSP